MLTTTAIVQQLPRDLAMNLLDCHGDALYHIIERLSDYDLISFAFTCLRLARLTRLARTTRNLVDKYPDIVIDTDDYPSTPVDMLMQQPLISNFVKTLAFNPACIKCDTNTTQPPPREQQLMLDTIERCAFLNSEQRQSWGIDTGRGYPNAVFLVLLVLCLNVITLVLNLPSPEFIVAICRPYHQWHEARERVHVRLPQITHLVIDMRKDYVCPHYFAFRDITDLLCLRDVRSFVGHKMYSREDETPMTLQRYRVTDLEIHRVAQQPSEMIDILVNLPDPQRVIFHDKHHFARFVNGEEQGILAYVRAVESGLRGSDALQGLSVTVEGGHLCFIQTVQHQLL